MKNPMLSALYHRQTSRHPSSPLVLTALLTTHDPETAFELTNHGVRAQSWPRNPGVLAVSNGSERSTGTGDVLVVGDQVHAYMRVGTQALLLPHRVIPGQVVWHRGAATFDVGLLSETTSQTALAALRSVTTQLPGLLGRAAPNQGGWLTLNDPQADTSERLRRAATIGVPSSTVPLSVAALKRELQPGRHLAVLARRDAVSCDDARLPVPLLREVLHVGGAQAIFSAPETAATRSYLTFPTAKNSTRLAGFEGGFVLEYPGESTLVYGWLD